NRDRAVRQLDARLEELLEKLRKNRPSEDPWMVRRAYEIATERHHDQFRSSGDPYLSHLLEVAHILADMRLDATTLTAAILHDAIEDTEYPVSRIEERFGSDVAHLVAGVTKISHKAPAHKKFLEEVQATIQTRLVEASIPAELESRVKGLYSVHRKIIRQEIGLGQVYDLLAVRVITDSERNCYAALGVVHHIWRPVPGRFKDYIAIARPNLYQSLHTTVLHTGQPFEVQIRTPDMHRIAEEGVAAHWKYKSGKPSSEDDDQ